MEDDDLVAFGRQYKRDAKRKALAINIVAKSRTPLTLSQMDDALSAIRKAGYLVIDKERVVNLHSSHMFNEHERAFADFAKVQDYARKSAAQQIGRRMLDRGGIEFETLQNGSELRSTAYVIWPKPHQEIIRDETST